MYVCRSKKMLHFRTRDDAVIARDMLCHNRNCQYCQSVKAKKYFRALKKMPILYYKAILTKESSALIQKIRRKGDFYWRCCMDGNVTAIITTMRVSDKWIPFPSDDSEDALVILKSWLTYQSGNISMTQVATKEPENNDEYETYICPPEMAKHIGELLPNSGYTSTNGEFYVPGENADWDGFFALARLRKVNHFERNKVFA